jgi:uncharacterized heparinase superfamily protein
MVRLDRIGRNVRAAAHYRRGQILHRIANRLRRRWTGLAPARLRGTLDRARRGAAARDGLRCPEALRAFALDPEVNPPSRVDDLLAGRFNFVGETRELGPRPDWTWRRSPSPSHLWRINLHYHRFLVDAAVGALRAPAGAERLLDRAASLLDHWTECCVPGEPATWDSAWNSYAVSTRILNGRVARLLLCDLDGGAAESLRRRLDALGATSAAFLEGWLEWDLGGNHLLRNAAGLLAAGRWLAGPAAGRWGARGHALLVGELERQLLDDGFHEERAPMYHAIVLEDVLASAFLGPTGDDGREALARPTGAALEALGPVLHPDGRIALFNDSAFGIAPPARALVTLAQGLGVAGAPGERDLPSAGYFRLLDRDDLLLFDAGLLGPDHLPAHAHCDALSFELSIAGERIVVDTGVDRYEAGPERDFQRGTSAHSTLQVDGLEQAEAFGSFRMGRRPRVRGRRVDDRTVEGEHDGFSPVGVHRRRIEWAGSEGFSWVDALEGPREAPVTVRLGLAPEVVVTMDGPEVVLRHPRAPGLRLRGPDPGRLTLEEGVYCERFGSRANRRVVAWRGTAGRDRELRFTVRRG